MRPFPKTVVLAIGLALVAAGCTERQDVAVSGQVSATTNLASTNGGLTNTPGDERTGVTVDDPQRQVTLKDDAKLGADKTLVILKTNQDVVQTNDDITNGPERAWGKTKTVVQSALAGAAEGLNDVKAKVISLRSSTNGQGNP